MAVEFNNLSPAAWVLAIRDSWKNMSDTDLIHAISEFNLKTGMSLTDTWNQLDLKIGRPRRVVCQGCGRTEMVKP